MLEECERIHVTGGPGSGKTRLSHRLAGLNQAPLHDLDGLLLAIGEDVDRLNDGTMEQLAALPRWVSEGVYFEWALPFLESADVIAWLDPPWRVAGYRIIARHVRLEVTRRNRFPGWKRLYHFWRWAGRWYSDTNPETVNRYGAPNTRSVLEAGLAPYRSKLIVCRTNREIERFVQDCSRIQD